jgi:glyoxylase-like metal-dependent hydrolase (beta-lactamase superfamily II)
VLVRGFPAGPFGTNCFVAAPGPASECVIVDPGKDSLAGIGQLIAEHDLHPVAVLLTHGHIDHTWSVVPLCDAHGVPGVIHAADRGQLNDPLSGLTTETRSAVADFAPDGLPAGEPRDLRLISDAEHIDVGGMGLTVRHAPGHTPGSVVFLGRDEQATVDVMFSGDLLFKGSVGRVDGPGGDWEAMLASLVRVALPMADSTVVLPGHGEQTTIGHERRSNAYLAQAMAGPAAPGSAFPTT